MGKIGTDLFTFRPKPYSLRDNTPNAELQARSNASCRPEITRAI